MKILLENGIMLFPVKKEESASFFSLINSLHEKTSVIITTNKAPTEWVRTLNDEVLATAIIDRLLYRCEVIKLVGTSYRLENRKNIFSSDPAANGKQLRDAASRTIHTQE
jgi:DNA replication protein DnaC